MKKKRISFGVILAMIVMALSMVFAACAPSGGDDNGSSDADAFNLISGNRAAVICVEGTNAIGSTDGDYPGVVRAAYDLQSDVELITGVKPVVTKELKGYTHTSLTDRIEAASWASAALATHGDIFVKGATQPEMMTFLNVFRKIGGEFDITDKGIRFWHPGGDLKPVAIETDVHPGFMTDWQQPLVVALTQANGLSIVHETVYENRFGFTKPLVQMGATIQLYRECLGSLPCRFQQRNYKHSAVIFGPTPLTGRDIDVPDLRGGFSHLIAALAAKGPSNVQGISLIDRGYADFRGKLEALGADFD